MSDSAVLQGDRVVQSVGLRADLRPTCQCRKSPPPPRRGKQNSRGTPGSFHLQPSASEQVVTVRHDDGVRRDDGVFLFLDLACAALCFPEQG